MGILWQFLFFLIAPPLFLFWKIADFYIRAMVFMVKAFFGLVAWLIKKMVGTATWPAKTMELFYYQGSYNIKRKHVTKDEDEDEDEDEDGGVISEIKSGVSFLTRYKFRYILVFIGVLWFFPIANFPSMIMGMLSDPARYASIGGALDLFSTLVFLSLPFVITLVISSLAYEFFGDGVVFWRVGHDALSQAKNLGAAGAAAAGTAAAAGGTAKEAAEAGMQAKELGETAVTTASHIDTAGEMVGGEAAAGEAAAGEAGLASLLEGSMFAGMASTAASIGAILALAFAVYTLIAAAISAVLVAMTWAWLSQFIPAIAGFIMPILGLGEAYGQWFGQSTANTVGPQIGTAFEEEIRMVRQMGAKMGCALEGPQCLRQWRMNNTVRPGSESVGETYELRIDRFQLAQDQVDVAYKEKNYPLPVSFLVYNTRHGLKGITARDVRYRITVEDSSHQGENAYCSTGWTSINTSTGDFILPGLGVSPRETLQQINLADCGLLQPSMGVNRVLSMDIKYDYSSQATLYFDAMSRQHRREQGMTPDFTKSETAKTPVQSYINVRSPVTYFETEEGNRRAVPFAARFGFETPGFRVDYKVDPDSIDIRDSVMTDHTDNCRGLRNLGNNEYEVSDRSHDRIEDRQEDNWFNRNVNPAPLRCTFELTDQAVQTINPTGEELIMRIDANYTIMRQQQHSSFSMVNTRCTRNNCPLLVTEKYNETHEGLMYSECTYGTSVDAYGGCAVLKPTKDADFRDDGPEDEQSGDIDWTHREIVEGVEIRQGQTAVDWSYRKSELEDQGATEKHFIESPEEDVTGVKQDILDKMDGDMKKAVLSRPRGEKMIEDVEYIYCKENDETLEDFALAFKSRQNAEKIFYFSAEEANCQDNGGWIDGIANFFDGEPTYSKFESRCDNRAGGRTAIVVSDGSSLDCFYGLN